MKIITTSLRGQHILASPSSLDHYTAQAFVLRCFDDRFYAAFKSFLKSQSITSLDHSSVAGGAKIIASPEKEGDRDFILREIEKSVMLHGTTRVMLFTHYDCGAYGGLVRFDGDEARQLAFHEKELSRAAGIIKERFPNLALETYFIDKEGIVRVK